MITQELVRELAAVDPGGAPVTSCYLNVDGRERLRPVDYAREFERLERRLHANGSVPSAARPDLERISALVHAGVDRSSVRGLAVFACEAADLWSVVDLPVPVHSRLVVADTPALSQLESVVQQLRPIGVLVVDRQRTRILVFDGGEMVEHDDTVDELPRNYDERGQAERGDVSGHVEELAHQHLRDAAARAFQVFQGASVGRVAVGGTAEAVGELEGMLHPYLRERMVGRVDVSPSSGLDEIRRAVLDIEARAERAEEAAAVARLRDALGSGSKGAGGLAATLAALGERRVEQLLVSEGYEETGWRCGSCAVLAAVGPTCPSCGAEMHHIEDVVESAISDAMAQSCRIEMCVENADLDVLGRIGALLRY
ncbi:MAG: baeRF10 domain-containing protein [Acidimicrobiales bacterium]